MGEEKHYILISASKSVLVHENRHISVVVGWVPLQCLIVREHIQLFRSFLRDLILFDQIQSHNVDSS